MSLNEANLKKKYHTFLLLEKSLSSNTIEAYETDLNKYCEFLKEHSLTIEGVKLSDLRSFLKELTDLGIAVRSQARIVSSIKSFYHYLIYDESIEEDPTELLEMPKIGVHLPEVLSVEEINDIVSCIDLSKKEGQRNRAIIETLYGSGLRVSELVNAKLSNLFLSDEYMRIEGKGKKERLVPLSKEGIKQIKLWLMDRSQLEIKKGAEDYLFLNRRGTPLTRVMIFTIVKNLASDAGIVKRISPHTFRHSFATHLLEGGANLRAIQQMLGHESITTTEIYVHIDRSSLRREILEHHPRNTR
jgi:integrase/recombinase XerD